jgi:hypothetical protein
VHFALPFLGSTTSSSICMQPVIYDRARHKSESRARVQENDEPQEQRDDGLHSRLAHRSECSLGCFDEGSLNTSWNPHAQKAYRWRSPKVLFGLADIVLGIGK